MSEVATIFNDEMPERLQSRAEQVKKINVVYQFDISGDDGGTWTVDLTKDGDFVSEGASDDADCVLGITDGDFAKIWKGELPAMQAFMMAKIKVKKGMNHAAKLNGLF